MSIFTNAAASTAEETDAYIAAILDLLGDRDPLEVLAETPAALRRLVASVPAAALLVPEARGKWSIRHVLRHLADSEIVWGWRLRVVLAQNRPSLTGWDQDAWADRLHYEEADAAEALEEFETLRRGHLRLLGAMAPEDLERIGLHAERGEESVGRMLHLYAGHDLVHLRQGDRIRAAVNVA